MQTCLVLISVKYSRSFLPEIRIALKAVLLKLHAKLTPGWVVIRVNFDPIQEIGPKLGGGRFFVSGPFFARLRYVSSKCSEILSQIASETI